MQISNRSTFTYSPKKTLNNGISFTGIEQKIPNNQSIFSAIAKSMKQLPIGEYICEKMTKWKRTLPTGQNIVNKMTKLIEPLIDYNNKHHNKLLKKIKILVPLIEGLYITSFYALNIENSKKIPEERKMTLMINTIFSGVVGVVGGIFLSPPVEQFVDLLQERCKTLIPRDSKDLEILQKGLKCMVPLAVVSFSFRYLAPVLATPFADSLNRYFENHGMFKNAFHKKEKKTNTLTTYHF